MRPERNFFTAFFCIAFALLAFSASAFAGELNILAVSNSSTIPPTPYAGDIITLNFSVSNISGVGRAADNLSVRTELNENYFEAQKIGEKFDSIGAKSSKTVSLRFRLKDGAPPGSYRLPIILEYQSGPDHIVQDKEVSFSVSACSALKIEAIKLDNPKPHIGDALEITATIRNSCTNAARNVSIELRPVTNPTIAPFIIPSGSSAKIGDILAGQVKDAKFTAMVGDKVDAKAYVFAIDSNCDQCARSAPTTQFSFQVLGRPELVFSNIEYSVENAMGGNEKQIMQGSAFTLSVQLDNIGQEKAKAVDVTIDFGSGIEGSSKAFLGNINPDDSGAAVFALGAAYGAKAGAHPGKINVEYVDELGEKKGFSQDYSLYINPAPPTSPVVYVFILGMLVLVLGIVYFIIKFIFRQLAIRKAQSK